MNIMMMMMIDNEVAYFSYLEVKQAFNVTLMMIMMMTSYLFINCFYF